MPNHFLQLFGPQRFAWMYGARRRAPVVGPNTAPVLAQWQPPPPVWTGGRQPYAGRTLPPALLDQATAADNPPFSARRPLPGILAAWQPGPPMPIRSGPIVVALTPSPVLIELNTASDTGTLGDFITSDTSPDIDVTPTEPLQENDIAKVYDAGSLLGSHTITAAEAIASSWPMNLSTLSLGGHTLTVTITRNGAESAPSNTLTLTMIADNPPFGARRPLSSILAQWQTPIVYLPPRVTKVVPTTATTSFRYWRQSYSDSVDSGPAGLEAREIEFLTAGVDQATGGTPLASSEFDASVSVDKAFDATPGTRWSSDFSDTWPQWVRYDFGAGNEKTIDGVAYTANQRIRAPEDITVEYSSDGSSWTTSWTVNTGTVTDWADNGRRVFNKP